MSWKLPLFDSDFEEEEIRAVCKVLRSGWLTMGEIVRNFEEKFADFIGVKHAIAVNNCTAALHLAFKSLGIGDGDEVVCPSLTFVATANAVRYVGAKPIFADIKSLDEWLICAETIDAVVTPRTRAICVVHYGGYACDMEEICDYAREKNLYIVEDCAHAPGAHIGGKAVGGWGNIGCFSFFSNKNLSTGEGGMLTTNDSEIASRLRLLRSHGMTSVTLERHRGHAFSYDVVDIGYNYRPTEITAALGLVQLKKLPLKNERRRWIAREYRRLLNKYLPMVKVPFSKKPLRESAVHIMPVLLPESISRQEVMKRMAEAGVQTSIHYRPVHTFSAYRKSETLSSGLPKTEHVGKHSITLPLFPAMSSTEIQFCVRTLEFSIK